MEKVTTNSFCKQIEWPVHPINFNSFFDYLFNFKKSENI